MQSRRNKTKYQALGEFEALVLMAILRLGPDNAYGVRVHLEIEEHAKRRVALGALYTTLDRLERKGFVSSRVGEPTEVRGGRAKKYFKVEAHGAAAVRQAYKATIEMARGLEPLLGEG
jgi:DNA-binding PadR family transcriptional regulator